MKTYFLFASAFFVLIVSVFSAGAETTWPSGLVANQNVETIGHIGGNLGSVASDGSIVYLPIGAELALINVSDPDNPSRIGHFVMGREVISVEVANNFAYAQTRGELWVIDITNPATPIGIGFYDLPGATFRGDVAIQGNYVFVATQSNGLRIIDVSNPSAPFEIGYFGDGSLPRDMGELFVDDLPSHYSSAF